jgi:hypothetical protein
MLVCWLSEVPFYEESCRRATSLIFRAERACGSLHHETLVARALPCSVERADGCGSGAVLRMIVWHVGGLVRAFFGGLDAVALCEPPVNALFPISACTAGAASPPAAAVPCACAYMPVLAESSVGS